VSKKGTVAPGLKVVKVRERRLKPELNQGGKGKRAVKASEQGLPEGLEKGNIILKSTNCLHYLL